MAPAPSRRTDRRPARRTRHPDRETLRSRSPRRDTEARPGAGLITAHPIRIAMAKPVMGGAFAQTVIQTPSCCALFSPQQRTGPSPSSAQLRSSASSRPSASSRWVIIRRRVGRGFRWVSAPLTNDVGPINPAERVSSAGAPTWGTWREDAVHRGDRASPCPSRPCLRLSALAHHGAHLRLGTLVFGTCAQNPDPQARDAALRAFRNWDT